MINRRRLSCTRDGCTDPRFRRRLCVTHWREENPAQPKARKPLQRSAPLPRSRPVRSARRAPAQEQDFSAETKAIILARCGGRCEACGQPLDGRVHFHHRKRRRDGGHAPSNGVALHPDCHVVAPQAVHQRPAWAKERGLIVSSWADPAEEVLVLADRRRVLLDDAQGRYLPPPDGVPYAA